MRQPITNPSAQLDEQANAFAMPFSRGDVIAGKYDVIDLIGVGAMGYVVSARRIELGDKVAIKFLRPQVLEHDELVARFLREARTAVMIRSEHVVRVFDVGTLRDFGPFIAMEFLDGEDLSRVIHGQGPLPVALAAEYVLQACEALATAHASGIVHRDVKPENLFLTRSVQGPDVIKVLDFGISKIVLSEDRVDRKPPYIITMSTVGSPMYMSPEQVRASKDIDPRCDVWGLGCVLYELLTGAAAFDALSLTELASKILEVDPASMASHGVDVDPALEALVLRCLHKDREKRFANIGELAVALCPFASSRAHIWAERSCYVLSRAASLAAEAIEAMKMQAESIDAPAPTLRTSIGDVGQWSSGDAPLDDVSLLPFGWRKPRPFSKVNRRLGLVLALSGMAAGFAIWHLRPSSAVSGGVGSTVLATGISSRSLKEAASAAPPAASSASTAHSAETKATSSASSPDLRSATPPAARGYGQASRALYGPRTPAVLRAAAQPSRGREPFDAASRVPAAKAEVTNKVPLVGDDWRAELVE